MSAALPGHMVGLIIAGRDAPEFRPADAHRLEALDLLEEACRAALELRDLAEAVGAAAADNRLAPKEEQEVERIMDLLRNALAKVEGRS